MAAKKAAVKPVVKKPAPAPKKQTTAQMLDAIGEEVVLTRIANCEFIHKIAESYGVSATSLHTWLDGRPEMYARARERQADKLVSDMLQIADDGANDTYVDEEGNTKTDQDVVARSRLRIEARKWLAGKMNAKRYGDKLDITADVTTRNLTMEQVNLQIARLQAKLDGAD